MNVMKGNVVAVLAWILFAAGLLYVKDRREKAYWQDVTDKSPLNARAANNLGYAYALACRDAEAIREFRRAMRLDRKDYRAPSNLRLLSEGALFPDNARRCPGPAPRPSP